MKCRCCGREIKDSASWCPFCGDGYQGSVSAYEVTENNKDKRKSARGLLSLLLALVLVMRVIAVLLLACGAISLLGLWQMPLRLLSGTAGETIAEIEAYYQDFTDDDVVYENGIVYVDSQILLTAKDGVSKEYIEELAAELGGSVVGYISVSNDYQIEFESGKIYQELIDIISELEGSGCVEMVSPHYACRYDTDSIDYTLDPWEDDYADEASASVSWDEAYPGGTNWWAEAVMMPSVWDMDIEYETVGVGIYDTMFDTEQYDLSNAFVKTWNNPDDVAAVYANAYYNALLDYDTNYGALSETTVLDYVNSSYYHGTHVAGLIAAEAENGFGMAGVAQNAQLYGFAFSSEQTDTEEVSRWGSIFEIKYAIAQMLNEGVKVINFSMGFDELSVAAQHGVGTAVTTLDTFSNSLELFLDSCLEAGYDFLIVKSAGNLNNMAWSACEVSKEHPYGYESGTFTGYFTDSTTYVAEYDFMGAITQETVKEHILIVGAAENQGSYYTTASFSTVGDRVDVYAPGVDILSTMPADDTGLRYGTSMAAPIVSGIAALIWGINPDLSAAEVAEIIRTSVSAPTNNDGDTQIVNACSAVLAALADSAQETGADADAGIVMGMTYITEDDGTQTALSDVCVTVADADGEWTDQASTTTIGGYSFALPAGTYTITAEADGYQTVTEEVYLAENETLTLDIEMVELSIADRGILEDEYIIFELSDLILEYGVFDANQKGTMQTVYDDWFDPSGILSATILDFDSDGTDEMLVCVAQECGHADEDKIYNPKIEPSDDCYHINLYMYDYIDEEIVCADTEYLGAYYLSDYSDTDKIEVTLQSNYIYEEIIALSAVQADGRYYIMCENKLENAELPTQTQYVSNFVQNYWMLEYTNGAFRYVCSFTQNGNGSASYKYTAYAFEDGLCTDSETYSCIWYEGNTDYADYGEEISALFGRYDVDLVENLQSYDVSSYESILSDENDATLIFELVNSLTDSDDLYNEFEAVLKRGNDLLE